MIVQRFISCAAKLAGRPGRFVAVLLSLAATLHCTAAFGITFATIQLITDGDSSTDDRGRANSDINSVAIKVNSLVTMGNYQFTSYYDGSGKLIVGQPHERCRYLEPLSHAVYGRRHR